MQGEAQDDAGSGDAMARLHARVAALEASLAEERRRAQPLEEAGAFHRTLIEASDDLIFVIDREGRVLYVNPAAARLIGAPPEAIVGRRRAELFPPDIAAQQEASLRRVFETGETVDVDSWIVYPRGRIWANSQLIPVRDAGGRVEFVVGFSRDISRRKAAEDALLQSEQKFRDLAEGMPDGAALIDQDTMCWVNAALCEMYGYREEELLGQRVEMTVAPEVRDAVTRRYQDRVAGKDAPSRYESVGLRKDGTRLNIEVHARVVTVEGRPMVQAILRDITERKRAEEALRAFEERYRNVFNTAPLALVVWDRDCGVVDWNARAEKVFGWPRAEVLGRNFLGFLIPEGARPQVEEVVERLLRGEVPNRSVNDNVTKSGQTITCEWNNSVLRDAAGHITGVISLGLDITEQKRAKDALTLSELQHRSTLDSLADGVHVVDRDLHLVLYNRTLVEWLRAQGIPFEPQGRTVFEVFPFLPPRVRDEYRHVLATGETQVTEETTRINGEDVVTETRKIPVFEGGKVVRVITVLRDRTEQRRLEREFLKEQKLESIGLLAGGIAHDFNNLLTGILANLAVARQQAGAGGELTHVLDDAHRAAERARTLTQRLLTFSGGGAPICAPIALAPLVGEARELALASSFVGCDVRLPDGLWQLNADAGQIAQVLQNLLLNARQAMPRGGRLEIAAENCAVGPDTPLPIAPGHYVRLAVKDQGVGIAPENLSRLFTPYFSTRQGGRGLGLAAAHSIVRRHGGCIAVQSELGVGSTFTIYLPAADAPATAPPPPAPRPAPAAGHRVLVMDDDEIIRRAARRLLQARGHDVELAADGAEAIEVFARAQEAGRPFDAVVLDLTVLEGMGGEECLQRLRQIAPAVRAILCSGYSQGPAIADFRKLGFQSVLRKPFSLDDLCRAIDAAVAHELP